MMRILCPLLLSLAACGGANGEPPAAAVQSGIDESVKDVQTANKAASGAIPVEKAERKG